MSSLKIVDDVMVYCPLLSREITETYCAEVNLVAFGICKPEMIDDTIVRTEAEKICEKCSHRSL